jgi:hypothetical protein
LTGILDQDIVPLVGSPEEDTNTPSPAPAWAGRTQSSSLSDMKVIPGLIFPLGHISLIMSVSRSMIRYIPVVARASLLLNGSNSRILSGREYS